MNRIQADSKTNPHLYISIFALLIGGLLFGIIGAEAMMTSDVTRPSDVSLVQSDSENAVIGISSQPSITENTTNQEFATITNHQPSTVEYTITLPADVSNSVSFRSTLSTSISPDRDTATVTLNSGEAATLFVDVEPNAADDLHTATFRVNGANTEGSFTLSVANSGPDVTTE